MIELERDLGLESETKTLNIKGFRLILPEEAINLGVITEAPVFVSRSTASKQKCHYCGVDYSALTYQRRGVTRAQHLHEDQFEGGGIYFEEISIEEFLEQGIKISMFGWLAIVTPSGRVVTDEGYSFCNSKGKRAEEAMPDTFFAFCHAGHRSHGILLLREGFACGLPEQNGSLIPVCAESDETELYAKYYFKIEGGEVLFSDILAPR